ncbi:hypothetical protein HCC61_13900 [Streptomyces sp. HNM0575]|uniref:hypothetical protein n=1 Tax=Streptomyces sp. HNM0575 TaxID=2716338 RepID=UPI00145C4FA0|nr:hypothetical protein [Streptomyces sp. HNM0575]NLU73760.1 hypothetical protein [Streptomyces sp. HNM0575]
MTERRPTPEEAARALDQIERREEQAISTATGEALWVRVAMGLVMLGYLASQDFLGSDARTWVYLGFSLVVVTYAVLLRTRRGSGLLGRSVRVDRKAAAHATQYTQWIPFAIVALAIGLGYAGNRMHLGDVPYWHTGLGVVLAVTVAFFSPAMERGLLSLGRRTPRGTDAVRP